MLDWCRLLFLFSILQISLEDYIENKKCLKDIQEIQIASKNNEIWALRSNYQYFSTKMLIGIH